VHKDKLIAYRIVVAITKKVLMILCGLWLECYNIVHTHLVGDERVEEVIEVWEELKEALNSEELLGLIPSLLRR